MNKQIEFALKNERFPFSAGERGALVGIGIALLTALVVTNLKVQSVSFLVISTIVAIILGILIYQGMASSLYFHPIETRFSLANNKKLIQICLQHLNIKAYKDNEYENVFVCFIHDKNNQGRQEIYLIAKEGKVLINSNKSVGSDEEDGTIDFVERIGTSIYLTARKMHQRQMKKQ